VFLSTSPILLGEFLKQRGLPVEPLSFALDDLEAAASLFRPDFGDDEGLSIEPLNFASDEPGPEAVASRFRPDAGDGQRLPTEAPGFAPDGPNAEDAASRFRSDAGDGERPPIEALRRSSTGDREALQHVWPSALRVPTEAGPSEHRWPHRWCLGAVSCRPCVLRHPEETDVAVCKVDSLAVTRTPTSRSRPVPAQA